VSIQRDSLGRFMNLWEIPAEAVIYSWGRREYALPFWPASFHTALEYARNTSTKCIIFQRGRGKSAGSFTVRQPKTFLARSPEAGEAVSIHDCGTVL